MFHSPTWISTYRNLWRSSCSKPIRETSFDEQPQTSDYLFIDSLVFQVPRLWAKRQLSAPTLPTYLPRPMVLFFYYVFSVAGSLFLLLLFHAVLHLRQRVGMRSRSGRGLIRPVQVLGLKG